MEKNPYKSYMLRFWQESEEDAWRIRLEPIREAAEPSALIKHFADVESLMTYLKDVHQLNKHKGGDKHFFRDSLSSVS